MTSLEDPLGETGENGLDSDILGHVVEQILAKIDAGAL